jgi:DNA-binding response OmpR family regulator
MKLLLAFLRQPGRVLPRSLLLQSVWSSSSASSRTVDKHVENLRRKLPPLGAKIETVIGVGYLFHP